LRLDKSDWDKFPAAQAVVLLQDELRKKKNRARKLAEEMNFESGIDLRASL
jgi:hypothetical protein